MVRYLFVAVLFFALSCDSKELIVSSSHKDIHISGRTDMSEDGGLNLYWSGSSIKLNFEGSSIAVLLDNTVAAAGDNFYNVIIDDSLVKVLQLEPIKQYYELSSGLAPGEHSLELFKRTEFTRGTTTFYGFRISGDAMVLPKDIPKDKVIEFYGNSITAGYAVEDTSGRDNPAGTYTNNYLSYASFTARHFDADYSCVCQSGIGVMLSWFPSKMPLIFNRINPLDSASIYDFSISIPDVVVVNLLQNDSWLVNMPNNELFIHAFGTTVPSEEFIINAYENFIQELRNHYPHASIICMLGNMDAAQDESPWPSYIQKAVDLLQDDKIYTHFPPYKNTVGHPSIDEQQQLAQSLIRFMDETINW